MLGDILSGGNIRDIVLSILYMLPAILVSLSCHEWAHAFVAYKCGDPTARNLGRMTVNPFAHIDPLGFIMLIFAGFGWAKPVPVNSRNFKNPRKDDIMVSLAGIVVNILLLFVFTGIYLIFFIFPQLYNEMIVNFIFPFMSVNAVLAIFNLLPIPPLDGYRVVEALLVKLIGPRPFMFLQRYGTIILLVLLLSGATSGIISAGANFLVETALNFYGLFLPLI